MNKLKQWQASARSKLARKGMSIGELAAELDIPENTVYKALSTDRNYPSAEKKIREYLNIGNA